jgi:hypothetical protein
MRAFWTIAAGCHTELYQCCIHPWMRIAISAKKG